MLNLSSFAAEDMNFSFAWACTQVSLILNSLCAKCEVLAPKHYKDKSFQIHIAVLYSEAVFKRFSPPGCNMALKNS